MGNTNALLDMHTACSRGLSGTEDVQHSDLAVLRTAEQLAAMSREFAGRCLLLLTPAGREAWLS